MARSFRHVHRGVQGRVPANFNMPGVVQSRQAVIQITAAEVSFDTGANVIIGPDGTPVEQAFMYHIGDADIWVSNISPHFNDHFAGEEGGVEYVLHVDFPSPLNVAVTITVEDETIAEVV